MTDINTDNLTRDALRILIAKLQDELGVPKSATAKLRKAELVEIADELRQATLVGKRDEAIEEGWDDPTGGIAAPDGLGNPGDAEPQVYQGAMHEAADLVDVASEAAYAEMARQVDDLVEKELAAQRHRDMIKEQTRIATRAWYDRPVQVTSMGRAVQGRVVAVTLREYPGRGYVGQEALFIVAHDGHATRRTLHALHDVKLMAVAS